jgi:hypothetical protein
MAESFNTFNRTNLQFPNNIFGTGATPVTRQIESGCLSIPAPSRFRGNDVSL